MVGTDLGKVTLEWNAPASDGGFPVSAYYIQATEAGSSQQFRDFGKVDAKTLKYEVKGLVPGKDYVFRIKAENPVGMSDKAAELAKPVKAGHPSKFVMNKNTLDNQTSGE